MRRLLFPPMMSLLTCPGHGNLGRGQAAVPAASLEQVCGSGICLCVRVRVCVGGCVGGGMGGWAGPPTMSLLTCMPWAWEPKARPSCYASSLSRTGVWFWYMFVCACACVGGGMCGWVGVNIRHT